MPAPVRIPDKAFFKIGEVSQITGVKPHVLRYWESEFGLLRPQKSAANQRLYRRVDVEQLLLIKRLLYDEGFTIVGANRRLRELRRTPRDPAEQLRRLVATLRDQLEGLAADLQAPPATESLAEHD